MDYEERIKYRDNEFLYEKCCKQYNVLMEYQHKMRDYKQQIETLEEENKKLKEKVVELSNHLSLYSSEETLLNRIDKAIEYIKEGQSMTSTKQVYISGVDLLKILKGKK